MQWPINTSRITAVEHPGPGLNMAYLNLGSGETGQGLLGKCMTNLALQYGKGFEV